MAYTGWVRRAARWHWVVAVVVLAVAAGGVTVALDSRGRAVPAATQAQWIALIGECEAAAKAKLEPLVTEMGAKWLTEQVDGTDWRVTGSVNHKTAWADNWYDVTCVIGWTSPKLTVRSVVTAAR